MTVREAITKLPEVEPHVVVAQIHDGEGEFILDPDYLLGTPFDVRITAADGRVEVAHNGQVAGEVPLAGEGWYFEAGTYTQSNPERGEAPEVVGQVVIYALDVTHTLSTPRHRLTAGS